MRKSSDSEMEARLPERSSTEIVQNLFGRSVGPCWADDSCSYHRHHGRIYVSTKALCFYSNLFGFERRLCLLLAEIDMMDHFRSTSILVRMVDGEDFVFKSMTDRGAILNTMRHLKNYQNPLKYALPQFNSPAEHEINNSDENVDRVSSEKYPSPLPPTRQRAQSEPSLMIIHLSPNGAYESEIKDSNRLRAASSGEHSSISNPENMQDIWDHYKKSDDPPYRETVIENMKLHCTLNEFYDMMIADDAPWSIPRFQREIIGDSEIEVSSWLLDESGNESITRRTITFQHAIKMNFGIGPSSVSTRREQRMRQFGGLGMSLETTSFVKGIPASDIFYVEDRWLMEQHQGFILLTVQYQTRFTSRTLFTRLIVQSTKAEVRVWYDHYFKMLEELFSQSRSSGLQGDKKEGDETLLIVPSTNSAVACTNQSPFLSTFVPMGLVFVVMILCFHSLYFHREVLVIKEQIRLLREDHAQLIDQLSILRKSIHLSVKEK